MPLPFLKPTSEADLTLRMKSICLSLFFAALSTAANAQTPSVCDQPAYAAAFRSSYPKALATRQSLARLSEEEGNDRLSRVKEAITASGRVDAPELARLVDSASDSTEIAHLRQEHRKAVQSHEAFEKSFDVIPIMVGNDAARQAKAFCVMGKQALVALARKRRTSEQVNDLVQQRLLALGADKGVVYTDPFLSALRPSVRSCSSEAGSAAAEEEVELHLEAVRIEQRRLEAELDAQIKARSQLKGWSRQRVSEILSGTTTLPAFSALELKKGPLAAELRSLMQAESEAPQRPAGAEPCTWPARMAHILKQLSDLNAGQYALMAGQVQAAD